MVTEGVCCAALASRRVRQLRGGTGPSVQRHAAGARAWSVHGRGVSHGLTEAYSPSVLPCSPASARTTACCQSGACVVVRPWSDKLEWSTHSPPMQAPTVNNQYTAANRPASARASCGHKLDEVFTCALVPAAAACNAQASPDGATRGTSRTAAVESGASTAGAFMCRAPQKGGHLDESKFYTQTASTQGT